MIEADRLRLELIQDGNVNLELTGMRLTELHISNDGVEINGHLSSQWRHFLAQAGTRRLSMVVEGLILHKAAEDRLRAVALDGREQVCRFFLDGRWRLEGAFIMHELVITDRQGEELSYRVRFENSGPVLLT